MTAKTMEGALAEEAARRIDHDAEVWRRACEAMREACAAHLQALGWRESAAEVRGYVAAPSPDVEG